MTNPAEIVRSFYEKLKAGDASGALKTEADRAERILFGHATTSRSDSGAAAGNSLLTSSPSRGEFAK